MKRISYSIMMFAIFATLSNPIFSQTDDTSFDERLESIRHRRSAMLDQAFGDYTVLVGVSRAHMQENPSIHHVVDHLEQALTTIQTYFKAHDDCDELKDAFIILAGDIREIMLKDDGFAPWTVRDIRARFAEFSDALLDYQLQYGSSQNAMIIRIIDQDFADVMIRSLLNPEHVECSNKLYNRWHLFKGNVTENPIRSTFTAFLVAAGTFVGVDFFQTKAAGKEKDLVADYTKAMTALSKVHTAVDISYLNN